ncbi:MAG TPA: amidohydrolase family protein [Candidatus Brocadiia bacterium]|nr:amidohydrolase family protein [Candidatus Brocadiia bacterium]
MAREVVFRGGRVVTPQGVVAGDVVVRDGVVAQIGPRAAAPGAQVVDATGCYVCPGFVSMHVHGGVGFDLTAGLFDPKTRAFDGSQGRYVEYLPKVAAYFAAQGVTWALLATVASSEERLKLALGWMADYAESAANGRDGAFLDGVFLEGSFIKNPAFSGAQNPDFFFEPAVELFDRLNAAGRGRIRYALIAPEWGASAVKTARELARRGVTTGAGHTACTADEYRAAVAAGMRVAVHLTNGPTGTSTKPFNGGGALEAALTCDEVFAEQIMDGWHIYPGYVMDIIRRKGPDRVCLITDAMFAADAEGISDFEVQGVQGALSETGDYLKVVGKHNTLFGSVLTMNKGVANALSWLTGGTAGVWTERHEPLAFDEALVRAVKFAATNPARALNIYAPSPSRPLAECAGALEPGKRADVVTLKVEGKPGAYSVTVKDVFVKGARVR